MGARRFGPSSRGAWKSMATGPFRLIATAANRQPAFSLYVCDQEEFQCRAHAIQLLTLKRMRLLA